MLDSNSQLRYITRVEESNFSTNNDLSQLNKPLNLINRLSSTKNNTRIDNYVITTSIT